MPEQLEKGAFICSIDTELAWGSAHREKDPTEYEHWVSYGRVRRTVERLLEMMDHYDVRATWAFVGRLLIDPRDEQANALYHDNPQPASRHLTAERLADPEFLDRWYAPELLDMIRSASAPHEIGSHTFSHIVHTKPGYTDEGFDQDLAAAQRHGEQIGVGPLVSLIFPQNRVANVQMAAKHGFSSFRSVPPSRTSRLPSVPRRLLQRLDAYLPFRPDVSYARRTNGLWELPATYYYRHGGGWARWQSNYVRTAKLKAGLKRAATKKAMFHVWFHPYDLASDPDRLLPPLERTFAEVAKLRETGRLDNLTMRQVAEQLTALSDGGDGS